MALEIALPQSSFGMSVSNAYLKISNVNLTKDHAQVLVDIFFDAAARTAEARPVEQRMHHIPTADLLGDIFPAVYGALKALPEYENAVDC